MVTKYNKEVADRILDLYSSGKTLFDIENEPDLPSRRTISTWRRTIPEFGDLYDTALLSYSEHIIEEALGIADTEADAKKAKNRIDIRTWIASKYNRARFGDKLQIDTNVILDISPALSDAMKRMQSVQIPVIDVPVKQLNNT